MNKQKEPAEGSKRLRLDAEAENDPKARDQPSRASVADNGLLFGQEQDPRKRALLPSREDVDIVQDWRAIRGEAYDENGLESFTETEGDIEPFNLAEEAKLGKFDESGSFTWTRKDLEEDGDEHWLEQVRGQIATPRLAKVETKKPKPSMKTLLAKLSSSLLQNETAVKAIQRVKNDKHQVEMLTEACDGILGNGLLEVYSLPREALIPRLPQVEWFYRILNEREEHGPFSGVDMQDWRREGFFMEDSEQKCEVLSHPGDGTWVKAWCVKHFMLPYSDQE
jgi:hypothetical protein